MKKKPKFTIDGGAIERVTETPSLRKCRQILEELPIGDMLSVKGLAAKSGYSENCVKDLGPALKDYRTRLQGGGPFGYGNKATIKAFNEKE